ncbi:MAG: hypothetical protein HY922_04295 [Elusimicrobia bacterium]|nr:hypothetical protein [Elusimicrobiota bacterium]
MDDSDLERSRSLMRRTLGALDRSRRSAGASQGAARYGGPRAWRLLRRTLERLQSSIERLRVAAWPPESESRPEWERRRRELEARALRTESAQRELESRQKRLDEEYDRVFSELESIQEGWMLLQADLPHADVDPDAVSALQERLAKVEQLWGELLHEESHLARERGLVDRIWRWLTGVWIPSVDSALPEGAARQGFNAVRRRIGDMDRRWRSSLSELKRVVTEEEAARFRERVEEAERRADALSRELLSSQEGRSESGEAVKSGILAVRRSLAQARADLSAERAEKDGLREQIQELSERIQNHERFIEAARRKALDAESRMRAVENRLAQAVAKEESLRRENSALRRALERAPEDELCKRAESENLSERLSAALEARRRALQERSSARGAVDEARAQLKARLRAVREVWRSREAELKARLLGAEDLLKSAKTEHEREKAALAAAIRELQIEREELSRRLEAAAAQSQTMGHEARVSIEVRRRFEEELQTARQACAAEREARGRSESQAASISRELEEARQALEKAKEDHERSLVEARERVAEAKRAQAAQRAESEEALRRAQEAHGECRRLEQELEELSGRKEEIETALRAELEDARQALKTAKVEYKLLRKDASSQYIEKEEAEAELRRKLDSARGAFSRVAARVRRLRREAQESSQAQASLQAQLQDARDDLERISEEKERFRLESESRKAEEARAAAAGQSPESAGIPSVEPVLEPAWAKAASILGAVLAGAFGLLRRLGAAGLPEGQKALLKLAAGELSKAQDTLKVLAGYFEDWAPCASARVETVVDSALSAWEGAFRRRKIRLVRKPAPLPPADFHPEALRMAVYQILRNAYEAMPSGGTLTVKTFQDEAGRACAVFSDSGPGFSAEALAVLFEPFRTAKPGHLGLGLAFARRVAARFGGEISAINGPSGGAVVRFAFPPSQAR